jgi:hypothetical protein
LIENSVKWKNFIPAECTKFVLPTGHERGGKRASFSNFPANREKHGTEHTNRVQSWYSSTSSSSLMRILFAISIISFLALIWAAVAITRRIRASHKLNIASKPAQPEFSQYLFAAAEDAPSSLPHAPAQSSSQDLSASKAMPTNPGQIHSYDKVTSTERG